VSGSLDKTIKIWELATPRGAHPNNAHQSGRCIKTFEDHKVNHLPNFLLSLT
jgi:glucose repression regulatory protein TUP1